MPDKTPKGPPPTTKSCQRHLCPRRAVGFVIFEVKKEGAATSILPYQWRCLEHANLMKEFTEGQWKQVREDFKRSLGYEPAMVSAGLSMYTEAEVLELQYLATGDPIYLEPVDAKADISIDFLGRDEFDSAGRIRKGVLQ